jgi:hypothetical protein
LPEFAGSEIADGDHRADQEIAGSKKLAQEVAPRRIEFKDGTILPQKVPEDHDLPSCCKPARGQYSVVEEKPEARPAFMRMFGNEPQPVPYITTFLDETGVSSNEIIGLNLLDT